MGNGIINAYNRFLKEKKQNAKYFADAARGRVGDDKRGPGGYILLEPIIREFGFEPMTLKSCDDLDGVIGAISVIDKHIFIIDDCDSELLPFVAAYMLGIIEYGRINNVHIGDELIITEDEICDPTNTYRDKSRVWAHTFALELLMPSDEFKREFSIVTTNEGSSVKAFYKMCDRYAVHFDIVRRQMEHLGLDFI